MAREPLRLGRDVLDPAWRMIALQPARRDKLATLRLRRHVSAAVPDAIVGDSTRLMQVVTNIMGNAVKFTPKGGSIDLDVDVTTTPPASLAAASPPATCWLQFKIRDTGIGVEPGAHCDTQLAVSR